MSVATSYYRLTGRSLRSGRIKLEYPLVLFALVSRVALGTAIVGGIWQIWGTDRRISESSVLLALLVGVFSLMVAYAKATDKQAILHVLANFRSPLTLEMVALILCLGALALNYFSILFGVGGAGPSAVLAGLTVLLAAFTLVQTGLIFKFAVHPIWNTNWIAVSTVVSAVVLGLASLYAFLTFVPSGLDEGGLRLLLIIDLVLLAAQAATLAGFIRHLLAVRRSHALPVRVSPHVFYLYVCAYFVLPAIVIVATLALNSTLGRSLPILLLLSIYVGVFPERMLFFQMENRVYFISRVVGAGVSATPQSARVVHYPKVRIQHGETEVQRVRTMTDAQGMSLRRP